MPPRLIVPILLLLAFCVCSAVAQRAPINPPHANPPHPMLAGETVVVTSSVAAQDLFAPDPTEKVFAQADLLEANPARPGAPLSVPGYPIETASGGVKAPQYFAPGVAGDHGEPIAQYIQVGGYLLPNNLSANAHGNGYADPNFLIEQALAYVQLDGGSFNVLEGNHAVNLAAAYGLRSNLDRFAAMTGDPRELDVTGGLGNGKNAWLAFEANDGNGFLRRLEHRRQYKANGLRTMQAHAHRVTVIGIAYYGRSFIPGLAPIVRPDPADTIDPRQRAQTHTALAAVNDVWAPDGGQQFLVSGFFRTYSLSLYSDFGQGLIRQSEFRTVAGGDAGYVNNVRRNVSLLAGVDWQREAPRNDDLYRFDLYASGETSDGPAALVDASNVTIAPLAAYAAVQGAWGKHLRAYAGWRRDQIDFDNQDLVVPAHSFHRWIGVNSPKATVSILPWASKWMPVLSASAGESFFTEDPRIGAGSAAGTPVSRAHAYQLVAGKPLRRAEFKLTLGQTTTGEQLAKIDPDTGLQVNQGPGRVRFLSASFRQDLRAGTLLVTFSKADARDLDSGQPTAEAPRTMIDVLGGLKRLPLRLQAKGEFEYAGANPLGTGCAPAPAAQCIGVPVVQLRAAVARSFNEGRWSVGFNLLAASGYTGQTLESFAPSSPMQPSGVRIPSYAGVNVAYRFQSRQRR